MRNSRTRLAALMLAGLPIAAHGQAASQPEAHPAPPPFLDETASPEPQAMPATPPAPQAAAQPAQPADPGFADALKTAIAAAGSRDADALGAFYERRGHAPFWLDGNGAAFDALADAVRGVGAHGLPRTRYVLPERPAAGGDAQSRAAAEMAAMALYLKLGGDLSAGILRPLDIDEEINVRPKRSADAVLLSHLSGGDVDRALRAAEPQTAEYRALMAEKERLESLLGTDAWGPKVADGPTLHQGESSPRIAQLRARLAAKGYRAARPQAEGPAPVETDAADMAYDAGLAAQVEAFQDDYGLVSDGVAGPRTLAALNASIEDRLKQVIVNLERIRWMNHDLGDRRIIANIPDYTVSMYEGDTRVWHSKTVVGKPVETRTPEFSDEMTYMVVNPTWHVPDSIATRTYLPKLQRNPALIHSQNLGVYTRSGREIDPRLVNFRQYTVENFPFRIKQRPSRANALGNVKFMFPNQFAIYLHDTPARSYFAKDARAFSNGCVRLEKPDELAHVLLGGQVSDPVASFRSWVAAKSERHITLDNPVRVHLTYRTVWQDETGAIRYRADVYGRDAKVFGALRDAGLEPLDAMAHG